jgi:hypothetical protein
VRRRGRRRGRARSGAGTDAGPGARIHHRRRVCASVCERKRVTLEARVVRLVRNAARAVSSRPMSNVSNTGLLVTRRMMPE